MRSLCGLREQLAQCWAAARQPEGRLERPAREQHRLARTCDVVLQPGQCLFAVDEDLESVSVARRRVAGARETVAGRVVGLLPVMPSQPAPVVGDDEPLDPRADPVVQPVDPPERHRAASVSAQTPARRR